MRILIIHNRYQQPGGEDVVVQAERHLLETHGHAVRLLEADNANINGLGSRLSAAASAIFSRAWRERLLAEAVSFQPDIMHVHNFLPLISPSVHWAAQEVGIPSVQTLHNYRLICPNAILFRDDHICEDCVGKFFPWPGIIHTCYRDDLPASGAVAVMLSVHRALRTWIDKVNVFVALSQFAREKFIQGGLLPEKIVVKPNFTEVDTEVASGMGEFVLFAGRLSPEKGVRTILAAWRRISARIPIRIYGDGPLHSELQAESDQANSRDIHFGGRISRTELFCEMKKARFLVFPSQWYESFPMTLVEAFASGLPVVASRLGAAQEIVSEGSTGLFFNSGDPSDLARKVEWAWTHPREMQEMGNAARKEYEAKYTPEINHQQLMQIYQRAINSAGCTSS